MDLILMGFSKAHLAGLTEAQLEVYDRLLSESDHDLYQWVNGQSAEPAPYGELMDLIRAGAVGITKP